jgi:hypothetical protein
VTEGGSVSFTVTASGTAPLSYQWQKDGANLAGQTSATLTLTGVTLSQAGDYAAVVSNVAGSVASAAASLVVVVPPRITVQPRSQSVLVGTNVTFSVEASGTAPLSYQWRFNLDDIPGATNSSLTLTTVETTRAGDYAVVVSNQASAVTSLAARLTVQVPLVVDLRLGSPELTNGQFRFLLTGPSQTSLVVWASSDLIHWSPVQTNQVVDGTAAFTDSVSSLTQNRFYRATVAP